MLRLLLLVGLAALAMPDVVQAQTPETGTLGAKRVKPPAPGTTKRITVQVPPRDNPAVPPLPVARPREDSAPDVETASVETPAGRYGWFWTAVSPAREPGGPGRLFDALMTLEGAATPVPGPRLQHLQDLARAHGVDILRATVGTQVSPALVLAVMSVESAGRADAVSSAGAAGLMQLMPDTATRFGVTDRTEPRQNIEGGVKYLDWLMGHFGGDPILVLAGYNAGEGAVRDHGGVPPYAETRDYVPKVLTAFRVAQGLCLTPPQLVSDGCVFAAMN